MWWNVIYLSGSCSGRDLWRKFIISDIALAHYYYLCTLYDETWSICLDLAWVGICEENWSSQRSLSLRTVTSAHNSINCGLFVWISLGYRLMKKIDDIIDISSRRGYCSTQYYQIWSVRWDLVTEGFVKKTDIRYLLTHLRHTRSSILAICSFPLPSGLSRKGVLVKYQPPEGSFGGVWTNCEL